MKAVALGLLLLVLLGYGAFGWHQRRFPLLQVSAVAAVTGLSAGVLLSVASEADPVPAIILTSLLTLGFALLGTLVAHLNRRVVR